MAKIILDKAKKKSVKVHRRKLDEEVDLHDELSQKLEEYDGESSYDRAADFDDDYDYDDISDAEIEDEDIDSLENSYDEDEEDLEEEILRNKELTVDLPEILRNELKKKEPNRDYLLFKYKGEICEGVPMAEINSNKFIFKINDKMRSVVLSEIKIL